LQSKHSGSIEPSRASFPSDLQAEFAALNIGKDGFVTTQEVETAVRGLLNERQGRISLKSFDPKVQSVLQELKPSIQGYLGFPHRRSLTGLDR
jgi:hypothetical protein